MAICTHTRHYKGISREKSAVWCRCWFNGRRSEVCEGEVRLSLIYNSAAGMFSIARVTMNELTNEVMIGKLLPPIDLL